MSIKLTALRTITGAYGTAHEGQSFEVESEEDAESLESRGLAERYREAKRPVHDISQFKMQPPAENKMIEPSKNKRRA